MSVLGGALAKVGLSAEFGVAVIKSYILNSLWRGLSDKVDPSAKFDVVEFKIYILDSHLEVDLPNLNSF